MTNVFHSVKCLNLVLSHSKHWRTFIHTKFEKQILSVLNPVALLKSCIYWRSCFLISEKAKKDEEEKKKNEEKARMKALKEKMKKEQDERAKRGEKPKKVEETETAMWSKTKIIKILWE